MCGPFNLTEPAAVQACFDFVAWYEGHSKPRLAIAPSQDTLTIVQDAEGAPFAQEAKWGLAPINARGETVACPWRPWPPLWGRE
jgi:putative SOS response-associated peptidase YedK